MSQTPRRFCNPQFLFPMSVPISSPRTSFFPLSRLRLLLACVLLCNSGVLLADDSHRAVDFNRDIRPILSDHCFACHGPDANERHADLRLDTAEGIASVISDAVENSELIERLVTVDPDLVMPPPEAHKPLAQPQRELVRQWVESGARFQQHWSFLPPAKAPIPPEAPDPIDFFVDRAIEQNKLTANPMADRRTLLRRACLDLTGLPPSARQRREFLSDTSPNAYEKLVDRLIASPAFGQHFGRYWLDLVRYADTHGLHLDNYREMWPYRDWVINAINSNMPFDEFVTKQLAGDLLPDASLDDKIASGFNRLNVTTNEGGSIYEEVFARNVIDRTDAFGTIFLGLTTGCAVCHDHKFDPIGQKDYYSLFAFFNSLDGRAMDANIEDPPPVVHVPSTDQSQQLADLQSQLAAIDEEMRGPIETIDRAQREWELSLGQTKDVGQQTFLSPETVESAAGVAMKVLDDGSFRLAGEAAAKDTTTIIANIPAGNWRWLRLDALTDSPDGRVGVSSNGNAVLTEITVDARDEGQADWKPISIRKAVANIEQADGAFAVRYAIDAKRVGNEGWAAAGHQQTGPRMAAFFIPTLAGEDGISSGTEQAGRQIRVRLEYQSVFAKHQFRHVRLSLSEDEPPVSDESRIQLGAIHVAGPFQVENPNPGYGREFASQGKAFHNDDLFRYRDRDYRWQHRGDWSVVRVNDLPVLSDKTSVSIVHQSIESPRAQKIKLLFGSDDGHVIFLNGKQIAIQRGEQTLQPLQQEYELDLKRGANRLYLKFINHGGDSQFTYAFRSTQVELPKQLARLAAQPPESRSDAQRESLQRFYRQAICSEPDWLLLKDLRKGIVKAEEDLRKEIPTTLVWKELNEPRQANILVRGQYDQPGASVERGTPAFLPPMPVDARKDRLGLAQWLCSPENPLTARVAVNRFWQNMFGTGLVKTSEDFGSQGDVPSHPDLLDWLAVDFRDNGWDVKRLIKQMAMSKAYRRASTVTDSHLKIDPTNRLLARSPRRRLDAEVLRDQALSLAGTLNLDLGGPSVKPPQPDGLWYAVGYTRSNTANFKADTETKKTHRRSVYIFWKRTSAPPQMATFDAPSRESCTARRERTNTPLQALVLLNETQYLQSAKHLAQRVMEQNDLASASQQVQWLFETVTSRLPEPQERDELVDLLTDLTAHYASATEDAEEFLSIDDVPPKSPAATHAAWMVLSSVLLNLDEVVSTP